MSLWRSEASKRLPELQTTIASTGIHTPRDLWMGLFFQFERLTRQAPFPKDLLSRLWSYAKWSLDHRDVDVQSAVSDCFFTNLKDSRKLREVCPQFMTETEYAQYFQQ